MDRMEEYAALRRTLEDTPPALEGTVERARARRRRARWGRGVAAPLGSAAAVFAAFALLVNLSTPFALACAQVPVLKELAAAVAFSPSLKAAVEHDYVQYVGQTQTSGEVSMTVEYLIVDQKQLNLYYRVAGPAPGYEIRPHLRDEAGGQLDGFGLSWGGWSDQGSLECVTADFVDRDMPASLRLECEIFPVAGSAGEAVLAPPVPAEEGPSGGRGEPAAVLSFPLSVNPRFITRGETVEVGRWITLDGQRIYVASVEIYPTHIRLQLEDDPDNTAWLRGLEFYLEDEAGSRYEKVSNGISATGSADSPFYPSHRLESSYFGDAEHLTVHITGATWLDKDRQYARIGLAGGGTADGLPDHVRLAGARDNGQGIELVFMVDQTSYLGSHNFYIGAWLDPEGGEHWIGSGEFSGGVEGEATQHYGYTFPAGWGYVRFVVEDCPWEEIQLELSNTRYTALAEPVSLPVK